MDSNEYGGKFSRLVDIVAKLRAPDGCPWDREQTPETILPYLIEETYEAVEAIENSDAPHLCEELGDLLLEVTLLAQMHAERGDFTVADSLDSICEKLIRRHPHVFGEESADDSETIQKNWTRIKAEEKPGRSLLGGVPRSLPALHRARRASEKAATVGFDWSHAEEVVEKLDEELAELREAMALRDQSNMEEELGDVLFAVVNIARHLKIDAESALHRTTEKFTSRFNYIEETLKARGIDPAAASLEEMERLWQEAKRD
ncbi:MAG: nucleoside triphosphate pyrophosphohydrolase [Deltaproteobacteria bacterium]|nr:MAG: nucleoside triphosphate pyrophosphohydrolase [Deltaproteobacteria bacterium]